MSGSAQLQHPGGQAPSPGQTRATGPEEGAEEEEEEEEEEEDLDDDVDAARLEQFMRDRRRTRSLPAYPRALLEGGPGAGDRKRVKFADSMGLNLESVKHFSSLEEPRVPSKVLSRYRSFPPPPPPQQELLNELCQSFRSGLSTGTGNGTGTGTGRLLPCFPEPQEPELRVQRLRICLERITVTHFDLRGHIRVLRHCPHQEVGVRYTFNDWRSCVDAQALSVAVDEPGFVGERFSFTVYPPPLMEPGSALHFALYLRGPDGDFWDNNQGHNYTLRHRGTAWPGTGTGTGTEDTSPTRNHFDAI